MKAMLGMMVAALLLVCGLFGGNSVWVAWDEVGETSHKLLPKKFRHAIASKDLEDYGGRLANTAADVDIHILPQYAGLLGKVTFADLQQQGLEPFRSMLTELQAGVGKVNSRLCSASARKAIDLQAMKGKLDRLIDRATRDLRYLETLQEEFSKLNQLRDALCLAEADALISASADLSADKLASVHRYLADREREAAAARYRGPWMSGSFELSPAELAELNDLLQTLDVAAK